MPTAAGTNSSVKATWAPMMNDQMPPNFIVPPAIVVPCSPCWSGCPRGLQCGQQADQGRGDEREQQRIRHGGRLECQIHPERQAVPDDLTRPGPGIAHGRLGHDEPEHGSGEGQHERFGDDLRDHAGTARPQRVTDDHLRFAHRRAREDQRRDVRRHRPQQQQDDGVDRQIFQPQRITRRAPGECANPRAQLRVGGRLVGGQACRGDVELRRGVLPARSVGEPAEHLHGRPFPRRARPGWAMAPIAADCAGSRSAAA